MGTYTSPQEAARAYDAAVMALRGPRARRNFVYPSSVELRFHKDCSNIGTGMHGDMANEPTNCQECNNNAITSSSIELQRHDSAEDFALHLSQEDLDLLSYILNP